MASTSNSFDALQGATVVSSKKKRRNKKTAGSTTDGALYDDNSLQLGPRLVPSNTELESTASSVVTEKGRLELWQKWTNDVREEESLRRGTYVDLNGKPVFFRQALVSSHAFETLAASCIDSVVGEEQGNCLYRLLASVFTSIEADVLQQLVYTIVKVSGVCSNKPSEIISASKRALSEVVTAVKKADGLAQEGTQSQWKKRNSGKQQNQQTTKKTTMRADKKTELNEALEALKSQQQAVDNVDDESMEGLGSAAAILSISDLQLAFQLASQPVHQEMTIASSKKGKKNKNRTSGTENLRQEDSTLALQESRLQEEISELENRVRALRLQLKSVQDSRQQLRQKRELLVQSSPPSPAEPVNLTPAQTEVVNGLQGVVSEIQSAVGLSDEQKSAHARSLVDAMEKYFSLCSSRQEDILKSVKFLRESLDRRLKQEETMREISSIAVAKELIKSQKSSRQELETQIKEQLFESGDLIIKLDRVLSDLKFRANFIEKYASKATLVRLEDTALRIRQHHGEIKAESEPKKEVVPVKEPEVPTPKRRIDVQKILEEEGSKVRQEIAAKMDSRVQLVAEANTTDSRSPVTSSPQAAQPYQATVHGAILDAKYTPNSAFQSNPTDVEVRQPMSSERFVAGNPAGPVQRAVQQEIKTEQVIHPEERSSFENTAPPRRKVWNKVGPATQTDSSYPALPTPGETKKI